LVNAQYLDEYIKKSGKSVTFLCKKMKISRAHFYNKKNNIKPFNVDEVEILCKELSISKLTDKEKIFFAQNVNKTANIGEVI